MAYSEELAERIRDLIGEREGLSERKMFGGVAWMLSGNMAVGVMGEDLMVRMSHEDAEAALAEPDVGPIDFTGRKMRGFVTVTSAAIADREGPERWVAEGADFAAGLPAK